MKLHIVFELNTLPDVGLADVAAIMSTAAASFRSAVSPLGDTVLLRVKSAPDGPPVPMLDRPTAPAPPHDNPAARAALWEEVGKMRSPRAALADVPVFVDAVAEYLMSEQGS